MFTWDSHKGNWSNVSLKTPTLNLFLDAKERQRELKRRVDKKRRHETRKEEKVNTMDLTDIMLEPSLIDIGTH